MSATFGESENEKEIRLRIQEMRDEEIVSFLRDTVAHLDALADRLDALAQRPKPLGGDSQNA